MNDQEPKVGQRLIYQGYRATIRYIGNVKGSPYVWLGVEWDEPSRGKHSGSKDGVDYFKCSIPGAGSFIRLYSAVNLGRSFLQALKEKYVDMSSSHASGERETVILGSSNGSIEVEAIGLDKVRGKLSRLDHLRAVSLGSESVAFPDPPGEIKKTCPSVRSLDLSGSLLSSWESVSLIACELPALKELSLDHTRLMRVELKPPLPSAFPGLEELRLNHTMITWPEILQLIPVMPSLQVLEFGRNGAETLAHTGSERLSPSKLKCINFDENKLHSWIDVMVAVSSFCSINRLILTSNGLSMIPARRTRDEIVPIEHLGLQDNLLSHWSDIDALNQWFPYLKTLIITGNPIFSESRTNDARSQIIARLPSLESINGSHISTKERNDSELYYLSQAARDDPVSAEKRQVTYPRWDDLCKKHGAPDSAKSSSGRNTIAGRLIDVLVYDGSAASLSRTADDREMSAQSLLTELSAPITLRVLPTMPIRAFRLKILKALKAPPDTIRRGELDVYLVMEDDKLTELDALQDSRDLDWWGIQNDSQVIVSLARDS